MSKQMFTKGGYLKLLTEFEQLSKVERPKTVQNIATAAAEGDRSENAEYIYGKKKLREIDKRLQYLSSLLKDPLVVDPMTVDISKVNFGCLVTIQDEEGKQKSFTIVGEGESDYKKAQISYQAPVAKGLLGKKIGEIVEIELHGDIREFEILDIKKGNA